MGNKYDMDTCMRRVKIVVDKLGAITVDQAKAINNDNPIAEAVIRNLIHNGEAFKSKEGDYIMSSPRNKPRKYVAMALYVLMPFIKVDSLNLNNLYFATEINEETGKLKDLPVTLGFMKGKKLYEITKEVSTTTELHNLIDRLEKRYREMIDADPDLKIRYLIIVTRDSIINNTPKSVSFPSSP